MRLAAVVGSSSEVLARLAPGVLGALLLTAQLIAAAQTAAAPSSQVRSRPIDSGASPSLLSGGSGDTPTPKTYFEQGILVRSGEVVEALGPNLMGDSINEYSGGLEFTQMDVSLPGNFALPVAVGRHRAVGAPQTNGNGLFGDWDLELPRIHAVATQAEPNMYGGGDKTNFNRCSQFFYPPWTYAYVAGGSLAYSSNAFWDGAHLYVPGVGDQTLLRRTPEYVGQGPTNPIYPSDGTESTYPLLTKNHWQVRCLPSLDNGPGEGFEARSPDGTRYRFDHLVVRTWPVAKVAGINRGISGSGAIARVEISILPTQITDRFGNWVRYTYIGADGWRVATITSSDDRQITFTYSGSGNRVQSISDRTRTWAYAYSSTGSLQTVTQPDGSQWQLAMDDVPWTPFALPDPDCDGGENGTIDSTAKTLTITHPSGAVGSFTLKATYHGRSNVPGSQNTCGTTSNPVSRYFVSRSLSSKTLSGPGMSAMTWSYAYSAAYGSFAPCNGCVATKTVTVTDPSNNVSVKTFGTRFGVDEGLLLSVADGASGGPTLRTTSYAYSASDAGPYPSRVGYVNAPADSMNRIYSPQSQRIVYQQGVQFNSTATGFDLYARATGGVQSSSLGYSRPRLVTYYDQTALWVLGQVASVTIAGVEASATTFYTATALPATTKKFGKLQGSYVFAADGTLYQIIDPLNHATTYSDYMRGIPRSIAYADGTAMNATIDNIGAVTSVTNEARTTWTYTYDAMGRIATAVPPAGDAVPYNTKSFQFFQVPYDEYGLPAGHWRQTIAEGTSMTHHFFDARWRKRLTIRYDFNNPGAAKQIQTFAYDAYNRPTFVSYPTGSISLIDGPIPGTTTVYDALGRTDRVIADSDQGPVTTTHEYLSDFKTRVTNARGFSTTTAFQVFDEPDESAIVSIAAPESVNVAIVRDVFGKPLSITRSGTYGSAAVSATRSYVYDVFHLLCKTVEPETGATVQQLDSANNVSWRATGLALPSLSNCDAGSVPGNKIVAYTYDARNRLTGTGFGDNSPSIGRAYTPDGLPSSVVSNGSTWNYSYNNRRLLTQERLTYGSTYTVSRGYSADGYLSQLTYPDGAVVDYSPDSLGNATRVGTYATGVTYHPNGAVASYRLGNGIVHTLTQDLRGLPRVNSDSGVLQDRYDYDAVGNVTSIEDLQEGISGRTMGYDGLDRLLWANAPGVWGSASYSYDALSNMRASTVGSRNAAHIYDPTTNRLSLLNVNGAYTGYAYDSQGNVTGRGTQGFYFDIGNRMQLANGVASYAYDGLGRRTAINAIDGSYEVQMYSQAGQLLFGTRQNGMTLMTFRYIYLAGKVIAKSNNMTRGATYLHTDALGSPVATTSSSGVVVSRTRYEPYGNTAAGTVPPDLGFTGHVNDASTGLIYMQRRYYDPTAGRFLSIDPVATDTQHGSGFNRYEYAKNNPYRYVDPDGRYSTCGQYVHTCTTIWVNGSEGSASPRTRRVDLQSRIPPILVAGRGQIIEEEVGGGRFAEPPFPAPRTPAEGRANLDWARAKLAERGAADAGKKDPVVIGENMKERVVPASKEIGGHVYEPRGEWTAAKQERWAKDMKRQVTRGERDLVDIGRDPARPVPSQAYDVELRIFYDK